MGAGSTGIISGFPIVQIVCDKRVRKAGGGIDKKKKCSAILVSVKNLNPDRAVSKTQNFVLGYSMADVRIHY